MSFGRVHYHARRFIDGDKMIVLIEDVQGNVFRLGAFPWYFGQRNMNLLSGSQPPRCLRSTPIYRNLSRIDGSPKKNSTVIGKPISKKHIQTLARFVVSDLERKNVAILVLGAQDDGT
tara:strand:- start:316 stop:669 length:354 start_codon:yes stop_codon:yes gene_type:complete